MWTDLFFFFFSSRRRHTRFKCDWSSDVCSSDLRTWVMSDAFRTEHDSMGDVAVPRDALWRAQTQRAVENFPISGRPIERSLIGALASIKGAGPVANGRLGILEADMATAIHDSAAEVSHGDYDEHFPIDVFQTGSGTSTNMNANEVIATLASR